MGQLVKVINTAIQTTRVLTALPTVLNVTQKAVLSAMKGSIFMKKPAELVNALVISTVIKVGLANIYLATVYRSILQTVGAQNAQTMETLTTYLAAYATCCRRALKIR